MQTTIRALSGLLLFALTVIPCPVVAEPAQPQTDAERVLEELRGLVDSLQTATWSHDIWMTNGKDEEHTIGNVWWDAGNPVRVDITDGDNKGGTAVLKGDTVRGFRRGMLSFARLSFDVNHRRVQSVRGQTMEATGFVPHLKRVVQQDESRTIALNGKEAIIDYRNDDDLPTRMWLSLPDLHPYRIEVREDDKVVERHHYTRIRYNVELDRKLFDI